jgi:hypothetical protein
VLSKEYLKDLNESDFLKYYVLKLRCKDIEDLLLWISDSRDKDFLKE